MYSIAYDIGGAGNDYYADNDLTAVPWQRARTSSDPADNALQQIASPSNYYAQPQPAQLTTIFLAISADLAAGTSTYQRLRNQHGGGRSGGARPPPCECLRFLHQLKPRRLQVLPMTTGPHLRHPDPPPTGPPATPPGRVIPPPPSRRSTADSERREWGVCSVGGWSSRTSEAPARRWCCCTVWPGTPASGPTRPRGSPPTTGCWHSRRADTAGRGGRQSLGSHTAFVLAAARPDLVRGARAVPHSTVSTSDAFAPITVA